jgi:adenylate cyclase
MQKSRFHYYRFNKEDNAIARELATKAAEISPDYPDAWEWMGWHHLMDFRFGWSADRKNSLEQALELAEKAYKLAPDIAGTNMLFGALSMFNRQYDEAISYYRKAVELAPSNANAIASLAWGFCYSGYPEEAIPLLKQAMRFSPVHPPWYTATLGLAYMMTGDYTKTIAAHEQLIERKSMLQFAYSRLTAIYAVQGSDEKARAYAAELLKIKPDFNISDWSKALLYQKQEDLDWELNALRKAGLPEG